MPTSSEILGGLALLANDAFPLAVAWHLVVLGVLLALLWGVRPSKKVCSGLLSAPLFSVSILATFQGNHFNGLVFALTAATLAVPAIHARAEPVHLAERPWIVLGSLLLVFGAVYPHFLVGRPVFAYLYGAPLGVLPCPTLAAVMGAALVTEGLAGKGWNLMLAGVGAFYAVFGVLRLGVIMDLTLMLGVLGLLIRQWRGGARRTKHARGFPAPVGQRHRRTASLHRRATWLSISQHTRGI